jgi:hypothetical protein
MVKANTEIDFVPDISEKNPMTDGAGFQGDKTSDILEPILTAKVPTVHVVSTHKIYVGGASQESVVHAVEPIEPPTLGARDGRCEHANPEHEQQS